MKAARNGALTALGLPSIVLLGGMIGFGALAQASGFDIGVSIGSIYLVWAMPGQLAMVDMYASGANATAIIATVALVNLRFLPMTISLMPRMRDGLPHPVWQFPLSQFVSANSWLYGMQAEFNYKPKERVAYFTAFGSICMATSTVGVIIGYAATAVLPGPVAIGLVFLNAMFLTMLLAQNSERMPVLACVFGAICGPFFQMLQPDFGLPLAGVFAGTLAFWLGSDKGGVK